MDNPEHGRGRKRGFEEHSSRQSSRFDEDDRDGINKRKTSKNSKIDETEEWDSVGRGKDNGYGKKKLKHASAVESRDEDDYETRRSSRSKTPKNNQDDRIEKRSSNFYLEREPDNSTKARVEDSDKSLAKNDNAKITSEEVTYGKSLIKSNALGDIDPDSTKEIDGGLSDFHTDGNDFEVKSGRAHERSASLNWEEHIKADSEMGRRSSKEEDGKVDNARNSVPEEKSEELKGDKYRRDREEIDSGIVRPSSRGYVIDIDKHTSQREISDKSDEDTGRLGDRSGKDASRTSKRSRTPERNDRRWGEKNEGNHTFSDSDNERSSSLRDKGYDNDGYRDDRRKDKDTNSWNDKSRSWDGANDGWKKRKLNKYDRESKAVNTDFGYEKEWGDIPKRERERPDYDKTHGRPYRRDRGRLDGGHESSDTIEIRTNSFDYGRDESGPGFSSKRSHVLRDFSSAIDKWGNMHEDRSVVGDAYGSMDNDNDRFPDGSPSEDQIGPNAGRKNYEAMADKGRAPKGPMNLNHSNGNQIVDNSGFSQGSSGTFNKSGPHGAKGGGRPVRGGRGRSTGRDTQRFALPLQMMAPPFSPMVMPPGQMPPIGPNMTTAAGPSMGPSVFVNPFPSQLMWPGGRGVEMNMLGVPPGLPPLPSAGPVGSRFPPGMVNGINPAFFNQPGPGRGASAGLSGLGFNPMSPAGRGMQHEKTQGGWVPPRSGGPSGKAPSRGEQNDYSQNFVDTGMRPQNFIRELELTNTVEDYPKLRELIQKKDEIVANASTPPMYFKADLKEFILNSEFFGTKFDVILVDPPWEEYVHRAPGGSDHMEYWTFEEISNLKIEAIADTPSFIFLWVGDGVGLEQGRACLKKWGFRRCEDICWVKTNKNNATPGLRHDAHTLFQHSKEHCLMGIKGTVRRSTDGHIIHANIDTDIIIAEEPPYGSTTKPEDMYRIIEHFSLGRRRLELFGEDHNIRAGWLTVGKGLSSSNFNKEAYVKPFADKDGKVWQGGGGRNPPPDAPHLVVTTPDIEGLRPKSPPAKNQQSLPPQLLPQLQSQLSSSIQTTANSSSKRPINSPQNMTPTGPHGLTQEASSSNPPFSMPMPWASPMSGPKIAFPEGSNNMATFDGYGFSSSYGQPNMDPSLDFDPQRTYNMF